MNTEYAFACVPCLVAFPTRDEQKTHLLSDWHRYNLKRRLAELDPVTSDEYARKIDLIEMQGATGASVTDAKPRSRKKIEGRRSRQKHVEATTLIASGRPSQVVPVSRHEEDVEKLVASESPLSPPAAVPQVRTDEDDCESSSSPTIKFETAKEYDIRFSLFDTHVADSLNENLEYMQKYHSLYIHDREYLKDLEGFITYLGRKLFEGHQCLYCNRPFKSVEAVRRHMVDRGHRRIGTHLEEHQDEYEAFYDYTESYKELHLPQDVVAKLPALMAPIPEEGQGLSVEGEDEWEVVEEYYEDDEEEEGMIHQRRAAAELESGSTAVVAAGSRDQTWQEQLEAIGFRQAHLNEEGDLVLPNDHTVVSRKNLRPGMKVAMVRPRPVMKVPALTETGHTQLVLNERVVQTAAAKFVRVKAHSDMRLGVKSNRLYRYIARKNKIFI